MNWLLPLLIAAIAAGPSPAPAKLVLTIDGLGPVKIGMTITQVEQAIGGALEGEAIESDDICVEKDSKSGPQGVGYMFEDGKLARISIGDGSNILTPRRIGIGASAAEVRRAYPRPLVADEHPYGGKPAEFLTYWTVAEKQGISFETDTRRRVHSIHAGTAAIQYAEGCA